MSAVATCAAVNVLIISHRVYGRHIKFQPQRESKSNNVAMIYRLTRSTPVPNQSLTFDGWLSCYGWLSVAWLNIFTKGRPVCHVKGPGFFLQ